MVNRREKAVLQEYEERGWKGIRGGWPDWLFVRVEEGDVVDFVCVEVKSPNGELRYNQSIARKVLEEQLGASYRIEVVE
jgi:hypothetical protein